MAATQKFGVRGMASCAALLVASGTTIAQAQCEGVEMAELIAADASSNDHAGFIVDVSGTVAIVSSHEDDGGTGAAYIYRLSGDVWSQEAKLVASDATPLDRFGISVGIDGDVAVVGAFKNEGESTSDVREMGAFYVFRYDGAFWNEEARIFPADGRRFDRFGISVSIDGDVVAVGSYMDDDPNLGSEYNSGSTYIYRYNGSGWVQEAKVTAADAAGGDHFGERVAISGDVLAVGVSNSLDGAGSAYVFTNDGGFWTQAAKLVASDSTIGDRFGSAIAVSGDVVLVGAFKNEGESTSDVREVGAVYFYRFDGNIWGEEARIFAADGRRFDRFGYSVAIDGDLALIGAYRDDDPALGSAYNSGSAYLYSFDGANWIFEDKLTASNAAGADDFGTSAGLGGGMAIVGAQLTDEGALQDPGSAYVFDVSSCSPPACPADFNGDGEVNTLDFLAFLNAFNAGDPAADFDGNGEINTLDFLAFLNAFNAGC